MEPEWTLQVEDIRGIALCIEFFAQPAKPLIAQHLSLIIGDLKERDGMKISVSSVRKIMIEEEIWKPKKARKLEVHQHRERRACFGEMVQIDGSPHDWFEGRSPKCTLLVFIDDATGALLQLRFV